MTEEEKREHIRFLVYLMSDIQIKYVATLNLSHKEKNDLYRLSLVKLISLTIFFLDFNSDLKELFMSANSFMDDVKHSLQINFTLKESENESKK